MDREDMYRLSGRRMRNIMGSGYIMRIKSVAIFKAPRFNVSYIGLLTR